MNSSIDNLGSVINFSTTQVYNAAKAIAFEDLDVSAVVGVRQAVVLLKIKNTTGNTSQFTFKKKGDGDTYDGYAPNSLIGIPNNDAAYVICVTNTSGVLSWMSSQVAGTVTVTFEAFWK